MNRIQFNLANKDNISINAYKWIPEGEIKGAVQIAHGMAEHIRRYEDFANILAENGILVYGYDHRGHGRTSTSIEELGYISDNDGFMDMVEDIKLMNELIKKENPGIDIILVGHSMGSFLSQRYIQIYGDSIVGLILIGSNGRPPSALNIGILFSNIAMAFKGRKSKIAFFDNLSFKGYNNRFKPNNTKFDWLSRDTEQVRLYVDDPYCGTLFPVSFYNDLYKGLKSIHKEENLVNIPKNLPIYILSGSDDPVGQYGDGVKNLYELYRTLGVADVDYKLYDGGRHEILNESNRDEVIYDILNWINKII